jgi:methyl-accepting chemotaxis protein
MIWSKRSSSSVSSRDKHYEAVVKEWLRVAHATAEGDFEARAMHVAGTEDMTDAAEFREAFNLLLDRTDAYVRESAASLNAASQGRYSRRFLPAGMAGSVRVSAATINEAIASMAASSEKLEAAAQVRIQLADQLEQTVFHVAEQLAAASTELSATSAGLAESARLAVDEANSADKTVRSVEAAATQVEGVVKLISGIASQTQLLALNATIEAARAGEAGKGFAVVANEVKELAHETATATESIAQRVVGIQTAVHKAAEEIGQITLIVGQINDFEATIAGAVEEQTATTAAMADTAARVASASATMVANLDEVSSATEETTRSVQTILVEAREITDTSTKLQDVLAGFGS